MKSALWRLAALVGCLVVAMAIAWWALRTPAPLGADAPVGVFSASRALPDDQTIAARAHPLGSAEHENVRAYLLQRLTALGLQPIERPGHAVESHSGSWGRAIDGGDLVNVVAVLPGVDHSLPALAVMAHYDSVPNSPGAADDGAGVAAMLEVARAMKAGPQPQRDVLFVITDGEEAGLLGARAFFERDPISARVGAVLNMEARGGGGRVFMFQTAAQNGGWIDLFVGSAVHPSSNSLAVFLYGLMPNDTDFTVSSAHGRPGLNYAFIGRQFDYHAASSTPVNLDKGSLQHMGEQVLSAARAASSARSLPAKAPDATYADLLGRAVVAYPAWAGWAIVAAAAVLLALAALRIRATEGLPWRDLVAGAGAGLYILFLCAALFTLIRHGAAPMGWTEGRPVLARFGLFEAALTLGAFAVCLLTAGALKWGGLRIAGAVFAVALAVLPQLWGFDIPTLAAGLLAAGLALVIFRRPLGGWPAWLGVLALGLLMAVALQAAAPTTAFLVSWPLFLAALLAVLVSLWRTGFDSPAATAVVVVVALIGLAHLFYLAHAVSVGVGADLPAAPAVFVLLSLFLLFPLFWVQDVGRIVELSAIVAVVVLVLVIRFAGGTERHPAVTHVVFVSDNNAGKAWRATEMRRPNSWTRAALTADGGKVQHGGIEPVTRHGAFAAATPLKLNKPYANLLREPGGRVVLRLDPTPGARQLGVWVRGAAVNTPATLNGLPVNLAAKAGQWTYITWSGPRGGLELALDGGPHGALEARWMVLTEGWPAGAKPLPTRPSTAMPWDDSDSTVVTGQLATKW